ncbi:MAG: O-antigen ligase family protein [Flavobacterium sp.]
MDNTKNYLFLILFHCLLGLGIFMFPFLSKVYALSIIVFGLYQILTTKNRNNEALYASAYIVGAEVFLRMTNGAFLYEFGKYGVVIFLFAGMFFSGFSKKSISYWIFLLLLMPGIVIATQTLNLDTDIRKRIIFNISGPVCLGIASVYCYDRKISIKEINNLLLILGLPIISCSVYLLFYVPDVRAVITGTQSNFETSGGFGPNQVATILGLGMFVFFSRTLLASKNYLLVLVNLLLAIFIGYRGLITFSRGGMLTALLMLLLLLFVLYINTKGSGKLKLGFLAGVSLFMFFGIWAITQLQTNGLIGKRYANEDAIGRKKETQLSGREMIANTEINAFLENPFFGIGVAKSKEMRMEELGLEVASHSEVTRMLAEHGMLGVLALLILGITPMIKYFNNKEHLYLFCFVAFWFLTINHAAMRIAAPAFVYALSLLKVRINE